MKARLCSQSPQDVAHRPLAIDGLDDRLQGRLRRTCRVDGGMMPGHEPAVLRSNITSLLRLRPDKRSLHELLAELPHRLAGTPGILALKIEPEHRGLFQEQQIAHLPP